MGMAALALESNPVFPTYPNRMNPADVSAGLVLPEASVALLGSGGAAATLLLIFMAVTSAMSAELIAVSSIFTYDVYQTYINPKATGKQLISSPTVSLRRAVLLILGHSISMGYLYLLMGVIISSAVLPATLTLLWSKQNWAAATFSPPLGLACSLIAWLVTAKHESGALSVETTGANYPMLAGNVVALLSPLVFIPILTFAFKPQNYDWLSMRAIRRADDHDLAATAHIDLELVPGSRREETEAEAAEQAKLTRASRIARALCAFLAISFLVLWPMPMYGSGYVFSKRFFTGWVVVGILWLFFSSFCVGLYPLWEGRGTMKRTAVAVWRDVTGGKGAVSKAAAVQHGEAAVVVEGKEGEKVKAESGSGDVTPTSGEKGEKQ
ncbi:urea active transporter [Diplodia seriata]|uniref:Urea active transporter n=1 Tax=Diplodia seriata TaxID=420778 RepID=A0ABR3CTW5_9PEZI